MVELYIDECGCQYWGNVGSNYWFCLDSSSGDREFFISPYKGPIKDCKTKGQYYRFLKLKILW